MAQGIPFNSNDLFVTDTEFARFLRRELNNPRIFTGRFRRTNKWSVCLWLTGSKDRYTELAPLGVHPGGSREVLERVRMTLPDNQQGQWNKEQIRRELLNAPRAVQAAEQEDRREETDADRYLKRWSASHGRASKYTCVTV